MGNIIPIIPVAIDTWTMRDVANSAIIIRTIAPKRSDQGARLKNNHHTTIANPATSPPRMANAKASGTTMGTPNLTRHSSTAATTPGHSRSGFGGVGSPVCAMVTSDHTLPREICSLFLCYYAGSEWQWLRKTVPRYPARYGFGTFRRLKHPPKPAS